MTGMSDPDATIPEPAIPTARPLVFEIPLARPLGLEPASTIPVASDPMLLPLSSRRGAMADVGVLVLLMVGLELASAMLLGLVYGFDTLVGAGTDDSGTTSARSTLLVPMVALRGTGAVVAVAYILRRRRQPAGSVGLHGTRLGTDVLIGMAAVTALYGLVLLLLCALWLLYPGLSTDMQENAERIMAFVPHLGPLGLAALSVAVGLYEELVFRGFLMTRLRRATNSWTAAVALSTVVFASLHAFDQVSAALVAITLLSVVFSVVTIWRRSLTPAIVAHTLWNLSQFLWLQYQAGSSWK